MAPRTLRNPWGMPTSGLSGSQPVMPPQNATRVVYTPAMQAQMLRQRAAKIALAALMRHHYGK